MEFFHKATNFPFMATRRTWYALSALLVTASVVLFFVRPLNLTVEFLRRHICRSQFSRPG